MARLFVRLPGPQPSSLRRSGLEIDSRSPNSDRRTGPSDRGEQIRWRWPPPFRVVPSFQAREPGCLEEWCPEDKSVSTAHRSQCLFPSAYWRYSSSTKTYSTTLFLLTAFA